MAATRVGQQKRVTYKPASKRSAWLESQTIFGLLMVAPAVIVLVLVLLYPAFVALQNYRTVLTDPVFWESFQRSVIWTAGAMISQMVVGIAVALVLNEQIKGRAFVRGLVLFPYLVPAIVAVLVWRWIFSDTVGVANWLMVDFLGALDQPIPWFDPGWVMVSIIVMSLWKYLPYWALFVLARLQTLPPELHESAKIDGASAWQRFRYITLPWILPVVIVLLVLRTIWAFNEFDMVYLPAGGGPLFETTTIPVYIRRIAFEMNDIGHAAGVAMVMLVMVAFLTNIYFWVYRRAERRLSLPGPGADGRDRGQRPDQAVRP